jgi:hypothetical protein
MIGVCVCVCVCVQVVSWCVPFGSFGGFFFRRLAVHEAAGHVCHVVHALRGGYALPARLGAQVAGRPGQVVSDRCICNGKPLSRLGVHVSASCML